MPLFGRRLFQAPKDLPAENEIFRIEHTGEEFHSKEIYQKLQQVYALERWTCECTWRASLTHCDAMKSEMETRATLSSLVADYFHQPIFEVIHHNVKPLEKLAEEVSMVLSQSFVRGEPVQFRKKKDAHSIKGTIERVEENDDPKKRTSERASVQAKLPSDKQMKNVKYTVRLTDEDRLVDHVSPSELQRCQFIPNREKLKVFIRTYAIRLGNRADSPWIFYDDSNLEKYQIKDRLPVSVVEKFKKSMTVTLDEILREQERIERKKSEASQEKLPITNDQFDEIQIILSDDEDLSKLFTTPTTKRKGKKPSSTTKPLPVVPEKPLVPIYEIVVPCALLQKLDKARRDRGIDSKFFQRVVLQCARTLDEKQRQRLPDEYRSYVQTKFDELELKRRLGQMTDEEKKCFFQSKREEQKPIEDLDLPVSKALPSPNAIESSLSLSRDSIGDFFMIGAFLSSCPSLFSLSLTDDLPKVTQQYLRSFRVDSLLNSSPTMFFHYFLDVLQLLMKLLFREDENRSKTEETDHQQNDTNNNYEHMDLDGDLEQIYATKLIDIPLTPYTCQELTRLYLLKEKDEHHRLILDKLATCETKDLSITDQIDLLHLLINTITSDNELMSDHFEHLNRILAEASRERQHLLAERRKVHEEESKQKKLQLQNGEQKKVRPLITPKNSLGTTNDENRQASSPVINDENGEMDTSADDDLKTVLQRRRQMVAMSKELKEKREIEAQKQHLLQKRQLVLQKAEQTYQEALLNVQYGFRIKPLGFDRDYNRYWFFRGHPGLFVEKGWMGPDINYSLPSTSDDASSSSVPKDEANQWFIYDNELLIQQLLHSLNDRGIREHHLLVNLKKSMPLIHQEFEHMKKSKSSLESDGETSDLSDDVILAFRSELEEIETRLRLASLGGFVTADHLQRWQQDLQQATERVDLGEVLIQLQQTVPDKYASGIFSLHEKKFLQLWTKDCRTCPTYSRLHVLMMIFENAISWNKSPVGMKCKVCRKKHKDESILVCDQCCHGFHSECLRISFRPASNSTSDLWYCPACRPQATSKRREKKASSPDDYDIQVDSPSSASDDDDDLSASHTDDEETTLCCVCEMDNDVFQCTQCQQFYHCQCHQPPLRCPPRSNTWLCNNCRNGITHPIQSSRPKPRKAIAKRKNSRKTPASELEEESDEGRKPKNQRRSKRIRRQTGTSSSSDGEESSMELDNHESPSSD